MLFDATVSGRPRRLELRRTFSDHVVLHGKWEVLDVSLVGCVGNDDGEVKTKMAEKEKNTEILHAIGKSHQSFLSSGLPFESGFDEPLSKIMKRIAHGEDLTAEETDILFYSVDILCSSLGLIPHRQTDMDLGINHERFSCIR